MEAIHLVVVACLMGGFAADGGRNLLGDLVRHREKT